jgi:hypothetical protein
LLGRAQATSTSSSMPRSAACRHGDGRPTRRPAGADAVARLLVRAPRAPRHPRAGPHAGVGQPRGEAWSDRSRVIHLGEARGVSLVRRTGASQRAQRGKSETLLPVPPNQRIAHAGRDLRHHQARRHVHDSETHSSRRRHVCSYWNRASLRGFARGLAVWMVFCGRPGGEARHRALRERVTGGGRCFRMGRAGGAQVAAARPGVDGTSMEPF